MCYAYSEVNSEFNIKTKVSLMSIVLEALKSLWFKQARKENYPDTPQVTRGLNEIEKKIKEEKRKNG